MIPILILNGIPKLAKSIEWAADKLLLATEIYRQTNDAKKDGDALQPVFIIVVGEEKPIAVALTKKQIGELLSSEMISRGREIAEVLNTAQKVVG